LITARTIEELRAAIPPGRIVGFVPTMGYLHRGHLSLVGVARNHGAEFVVVSIFVNPRQFGPNEDFARYPRNEAGDLELLEREGVDAVFLPAVETMYPPDCVTAVHVGGVAEPLEGQRRPGHFAGVATIVLKLLNIVQPDLAVFGRKDAQQCAVISRMVRDLDLPVELVFAPTMREEDGLAMSSRNAYLSDEERKVAPALHRALRAGEEALTHGVHDVDSVEQLMRRMAEGVDVDYLVVVDPETFRRPVDLHREVLIAGAVRIGRTRIIDNVVVRPS
jgi:pantoate--beta-alanine ligase